MDDKGKKGGTCNRQACDNHNALWFNQSTRAYYCRSCAYTINMRNHKEAEELYGGPLCVEHKPDERETCAEGSR